MLRSVFDESRNRSLSAKHFVNGFLKYSGASTFKGFLVGVAVSFLARLLIVDQL